MKPKRLSSFQVTLVEGSEDVSLVLNTVAPDFASAPIPYAVHREDVAILHTMLGRALEDFEKADAGKAELTAR